MNEQLIRLGDNVRKGRRGLRISQEAFAERCGLHRTYVTDIERGARNVSFSSLLKLAGGLGITVAQLASNIESGGCRNGASAETAAKTSASASFDGRTLKVRHIA
jgi:transcriptional regulator with XRE-family HTH domain